MPTLLSLAPAAPIAQQQYFFTNVLPHDELVLLDGAPGVGKSLLCAALADTIADEMPDKRPDALLFLASPGQRELTIEYLARHLPHYDRIKAINFDPGTHHNEGESLVLPILLCIEESLKQHKPGLIVIDSLEELLQQGSSPDAQSLAYLWKTLRSLAQTHHCTLLVPRKAGLHESRSYGPFTRLGSEIAAFALALHYHPTDPNIRVLTTVKNQRGPSGQQAHAHINPQDGALFLAITDAHEHVRPARNTQTWQPDPDYLHETEQILELVEELMQNRPIPISQLQTHITRHARFSQHAYHRAMKKAKLQVIRIGYEYCYAPSDNMRQRHLLKQELHSTPATQHSGPSTQDLEDPPENQARAPRAEPCTLSAPRNPTALRQTG